MLRNELAETLTLDGVWDFRLGEGENWKTIQVPGCWEAQGNGMFLDGPAVYRREVSIPKSWRKKGIQLEFDAASYASEAAWNGAGIGEHRGLWTPFAFDITEMAIPGEQNKLEVRLYKPGTRYPMRSCLAGFIPDVSTTFGGLWQPVRLRAMQAGLEDLLLDALWEEGGLRVRTQAKLWGAFQDLSWQVSVACNGKEVASQAAPYNGDGGLDLGVKLPEFMYWSPTQPVLYTVWVTLWAGDEAIARLSGRTGLRKLTTQGNQLLLNGKPFMARGILSWGWEPDRIAPVYSKEQAQAELGRIRDMGFNLVKLCLFVPNQEYFEAADEMGVLLWQEWPMWLPEVTPDLRRMAPGEYAELTRLTRQHPSVGLYSLGCELSQNVDGELLKDLDECVRGLVQDVLVCDNSGSGESYGGFDFDTSDFTDYHPYYDLHYFEALLDNWRRDWQKPRPWIFGEFCDSDTFRDLDEIIRDNGGQRPWWLTRENPVTTWRPESKAMLEAQERLAQANLPFTGEQITQVSYAQTQVIRKYTLETLRRRAGMGGYIVTGLRDTPISTSGLWDDYGRVKWSMEEFQQINGEAVLCLDVSRRRRWRYGGDRPDRLDGHNFWCNDRAHWHVILHATGCEFRRGSQLSWSLTDREGKIIASGKTDTTGQTQAGVPGEVGEISCRLPVVNEPVELLLKVNLNSEGNKAANQWPVWVYPAIRNPPPGLGILDPLRTLEECGDWLSGIPQVGLGKEIKGFHTVISTVWNEAVESYINEGGRVLLLQQGSGPLPARRGPFWREAIKLFYDHPVWAGFPQAGYTDLQFFGLAGDTAFESEKFKYLMPGLKEIRPVLRRLDGREFLVTDYLVEARIGKGVLMACALRLWGGEGTQPYGWQRNVAGSSLLQTVLDYLLGIKPEAD